MKDLIKLKSRGYEENYLKKLKKPDGSSKTYVKSIDFTVGYGYTITFE